MSYPSIDLDTSSEAVCAIDALGAAGMSTASDDSHAALPLCWRVHLLRRDPRRLPSLALVLGIGAGCAWLMFRTWLPVVAAILLLIGSTSEYLFPITYRLTDREICQEALTSRLALPWKDARRCRRGRNALLITSLAVPSRLDAFRGVLLRFAPDGQPGDCVSVLAVIDRYAPDLLRNVANPERRQPEKKEPEGRTEEEPSA